MRLLLFSSHEWNKKISARLCTYHQLENPQKHILVGKKVKYFGVKSFLLLSFWSMHFGSLFTIVVGNSQSHLRQLTQQRMTEVVVLTGCITLRDNLDIITSASLKVKPYDGKFPKIQVQPSSINTWWGQSFRSFYFSRASHLSRASHATPASP